MSEPEEKIPLFLSSTSAFFETPRPVSPPAAPLPASQVSAEIPAAVILELRTLLAALDQKINAPDGANETLIKAIENEVGKTQTASRKVIREFKEEAIAAMDTIYRVSAEAQRTVEKRDKRRSRIDFLVFVTSAVVFTQAVAMSVYFVLGKL